MEENREKMKNMKTDKLNSETIEKIWKKSQLKNDKI